MGEYIDRLMEPGIHDELKNKIAEKIRTRDRDHWVRVFENIDACVEPVLSFAEATKSGHAQARGLLVDVPGPEGKPITQIGLPIKFSNYSPEYKWAGPCLGEDTMEIVASLGFSDEEIQQMKSNKIFGDH